MRPLRSNDPCWCGSRRKYKRCHGAPEARVRPSSVTPMRSVPSAIPRPDYAESGELVRRPEPAVKSPDTIERMRKAGRAAAEVLRVVGAAVAPGVTNGGRDVVARDACSGDGICLRTLQYLVYPMAVGTLVIEVIFHIAHDDDTLRVRALVGIGVARFP